MGPFFTPKRLQRVCKEVAVLHNSKNKSQNMVQIQADAELEHLIRALVAMDEAELAMEAYVLSDSEVYRVAAYIPFNYFKVNMRNLFAIFKARSDKILCKILYEQWQNSYGNESCNNFLQDLLKNNDNFKKYIEKKHLNAERMENILQNQEVVFGFGTEVMRYHFAQKRTLAEKFEFFGIHADSKLYKDCADIFYTYCGKNDYLEADRAELLNVIKKYEVRNQPLLKAFLFNFLSKLKLMELAEFRDLARYFESVAGEASKPKAGYKFLFDDMSTDILEKYTDWINRCRIERYFGTDERSEFWKQYRFVHVQWFEKSDAIVMEFRDHIAVEFLGDRKGPAYIYMKDYFLKKLLGQFITSNNQSLRQFLYHESDYEYRKPHNKGWEDDVEDFIIMYHVTRKVFA